MNIVVLSGNIVKKAEVKVTDSGKKVAKFSVAVRNGSDKSDFFNCVAWDKRAEFIENGMKDGRYLTGCEVELKGQLHNVSFDSTDPQTRAVTKVKYDEVTIETSFSHRLNQAQPPQGGYQAQPPQGGYQAQPPQGGYQAQPPQGGYQAQPPQGGQPQQQGGYQAQPPQGGQPQQQGGYQAQPPQGGRSQQQGGYQAQPPQGGRPQQQGIQTGAFQSIPATSTSAPAQSGGFRAASVNAPRTGGGYPEGPAGYGA